MAKPKRPDPAPGPITPNKYTAKGYPPPGPKYMKFGEQPGYIYDPYNDTYAEDPRVQKQDLQDQGLIPKDPKPTTLQSTIVPLGLAAGTIAASQGIGSGIVKDGLAKTIGIDGLLGPTGSANVATTTTQGAGLMSPSVAGAGVITNPVTGEAIGTAVPAAPGAFSLGGIGSAGNVYLPAVGAVGAYDVLSHDVGPLRGLGEGAASGAMIGSYLGPEAIIPGAIIGGTIGGVKGLMEKPSTKEIQSARWKAAGVADPYGKAGHDFFAGTGGEQSRDEKFLTPDAIRVNPDNYNNVPDWDKWSPEMQTQFLAQMLKAGKVQEKKGGIYYDDDYAKQTADQIRAASMPQVAAASTPQPIARTPSGMLQPVNSVPPLVNTVTTKQANNLQGRVMNNGMLRR